MTPAPPPRCKCGAALPAGWASPSCPRCLVHFSVEATDPARVFPDGSGDILLSDYELLDEIARGGMGVVYRARQLRLGRIVAVKVLAAGEFASTAARERFRAEAAAAARLQHPGIVAIHDVGEANGLPWFSMDLVAGKNLAAMVREQPLPARQAAEYVRAIAEAVQHAHDHGVLHRDLKPSNILLDPETGPRVTDFGIAYCGDGGDITRTGEVLGSPGYTAPEQALGGKGDARTDVYGLGALLYHLLTARPPFQGPTLDAIVLQLREADPLTPRRLNPEVPRDLETICLRCLRKDPAQRYATAREVAEDIVRFQRGEPIRARPISVFGKTWRWCRRRPAIAALLALLGVVAAVAFFLTDRARRDESAAKGRAESASTQLRETNTRLADSLDRSELDRADDLFHTGESADALALLARVVQRSPENSIAAARLASAFWQGDFALLLPPLFSAGGKTIGLRFLRDGRTLLVSTDKGIATWDAATGRRLIEFERDDSEISATALSPDERTFAAWNFAPGKKLRLLDVASGRLCAPPIQHESWLHTVAFSPDSTRLVTAGDEASARVRDARSGEETGAPLVRPPGLWGAVFSPDGATIATCVGRTVRWWDVRSRELRSESAPLESEVRMVRFSPDGRWLLAACVSGTMRFFSTTDGQPAGLPMRHGDEVRTVAFSSDGKRVLTASNDHTARVWSVPDGEPLAPPMRHSDSVSFATFSADGARIATCSSDHTTRVWDAHTGRPLTQPLRHVEQPRAAAFTPDGTALYASGADSIVVRWDLRALGGPGGMLRGERAEFSADGSRVIAAAAGPCVWETGTLHPLAVESGGASLARFSPDGRRAALANGRTVKLLTLDGTAAAIEISHPEPVADICFSADGRRIATASQDRTARVWDAATGGALTPPLPHDAPVASVRFSPDGRTLLTATRMPSKSARPWDAAHLWDAATGQPVGSAMGHIDHVLAAEFSPDGALIATASKDNTARVWDARTGQPVTAALRHTRTVAMVAFSPDSMRLATASLDGTARLWDARTGQPLARPLTHDDHVNDVQFSPDGRRLATASRDKTVRLWDAATGQPLTESLRHNAAVLHVCFHPDGQRLLASTADDIARIWEVPDFPTPPPAWLAQLAEALSLADLPPEPIAAFALIVRYEQTRAAAMAETGDGTYARLARRLFQRRTPE